ncbi:MAG: hypothetical protein ACTSUV_07040 [Candidatus Ranarchaeia archaeon]
MLSILGIPVFEPKKGKIGGVSIAIISIWVALCLAASFIPAWPLPGLSGQISTAMILSAITPFILGPVAGFVFGLTYGFLIFLIRPSSFLGPWVIITNIGGTVVGGLALMDKNKEVFAYFVTLMLLWLIHPYGRTGLMPLVLWEFCGPIIFSLSKRIRKSVQNGILNHDKNLPISLVFITWTKYMGNIIVGNLFLLYIWGTTLTQQFWVFFIPYYAVVLVVFLIITSLIGTTILPTLKRVRISIFTDYWKKINEKPEEKKELE